MRLLANTLRRQIHAVQDNEYEHQVIKARRLEAAEENAGIQERVAASVQAQARRRSAMEVHTPSFQELRDLAEEVPENLEYEPFPRVRGFL